MPQICEIDTGEVLEQCEPDEPDQGGSDENEGTDGSSVSLVHGTLLALIFNPKDKSKTAWGQLLFGQRQVNTGKRHRSRVLPRGLPNRR